MYSRKQHKRLLSISDAIGKIMDEESPGIDEMVLYHIGQAFEEIEHALAMVQVEGAKYAQSKLDYIRQNPKLPGIESEEDTDMELSTINKNTGEVKSASINSKDIPKILKTLNNAQE